MHARTHTHTHTHTQLIRAAATVIDGEKTVRVWRNLLHFITEREYHTRTYAHTHTHTHTVN